MNRRAIQYFRNPLLLLLLGLWLITALSAGGEAPVEISRADITDGPYIFRDNQVLTVRAVENGRPVTTTVAIAGPLQQVSWSRDRLPLVVPDARPVPAEDHWTGVSEILAVSDIHGQLGLFRQLLRSHGVIDAAGNWCWGEGHLVIVGDVFDRGPDVTDILWTIHQLEQEAIRYGGRVHFVLGNHEAMVLRGDLRYINEKYRVVADEILETPLTELYGPGSVLGEWLRTRGVAVRINDLLFLHGGVSPAAAEAFPRIADLNEALRRGLHVTADEFGSQPDLELLFGPLGPLWYRGYFESRKNYPLLETGEVRQVLGTYGVSAVVVGHTTQEHVVPIHDGTVIAVDAGMKHGDRGEALLWRNGRFFRATLDGRAEELPVVDKR
jgi:hypothetical protein